MNNIQEQVLNIDGSSIMFIHEISPRRHQTFQNIRVDEQYVFAWLNAGQDMSEQFGEWDPRDGSDNTYQESLIFFAPQDRAAEVKARFVKFVAQCIAGEHELGDHDEAVAWIAFRNTKSGLWILVGADMDDDTFSDLTSNVCDDLEPVDAYDWNLEVQKPCNNRTFYVTGTPEESGGSYFANGLNEQGNPIIKLMQEEGLLDEKVQFNAYAAEEDD